MCALTKLPFIFPACFSEVGFNYWGYTQAFRESGLHTIEDCRNYCETNCAACKYFTHVSNAGSLNGACFCKTSNAWRKEHAYGSAITSGEICRQVMGKWSPSEQTYSLRLGKCYIYYLLLQRQFYYRVSGSPKQFWHPTFFWHCLRYQAHIWCVQSLDPLV